MQKNIETIADFLARNQVNWRPHTKGIKIPAIAHKLLAAGAIGMTCSKLSEAEVMAFGGIKDILIASEIVGITKINRLAHLRKHADVMVCVDDLDNAAEVSQVALEHGVVIRVLVELDTGMRRCGLKPGPAVVDFVLQILKLPGISFAGLMSWEGHTPKIEDPEEKRKSIEQSIQSLTDIANQCREAGIPVKIVSCGGTGTFRTSATLPGVTEIEAGGGIFGDVTYRKWGSGLICTLFVLATVISHPEPDRIVIDAGRKSMNFEYSIPQSVELKSATFLKYSAEHSVLTIDPAVDRVKIGDKLNFIVGYGDLTVCLHDQLYGVRNGLLEVRWDITGRGKIR